MNKSSYYNVADVGATDIEQDSAQTREPASDVPATTTRPNAHQKHSNASIAPL